MNSMEESTTGASEKPKLRFNLQIIPAQLGARKMLVFQDPEQWSEELVIIPAELAPILQYFDGSHTISDIQEQIMREAQELVPLDNIRELVKELDEHLLLDSEKFRNHIRTLREEWEKSDVRKPALAGKSYPENPEELKKFLEGFYITEQGPGMPGENRSNELKAIVAPHIELKGNGHIYAHSYNRLFEESQAELFLIIGTGHYTSEDILVFSEKHFETPLGIVESDREFIHAVQKRMKKRQRFGDFSHRREHSIELQLIFLQHLLKGKRDFKIVPILIGSFQMMIDMKLSPAENLQVLDYLNAIREQLKEDKRKIAFIASADLAHLGPRYGDRETYAPIREEEIKEDDWKMLSYLEKADPEGFFQEVARTGDSRKICGLGPIYFTFKLAEPKKAEVIKWSVWYDMNTKSAVSFCSMALY